MQARPGFDFGLNTTCFSIGLVVIDILTGEIRPIKYMTFGKMNNA
jgi:hypothetical protein